MKKRSPVEHGGKKREKKRDCIQAEGRSERKGEPEEEKSQRGRKERGVIYASLGTRFYLFPPCELFYIGDLIKSNKSQHTHTYTSTHTQVQLPLLILRS